MSGITTHVLDVSIGRPARGVQVRLEAHRGAAWETIADRATDDDGRVKDLVPGGATPAAGRYRITFDTASYFTARGIAAFYPEVAVTFEIREPKEHHHVPLLLSPFGYSTYRGS